MTNEQKTASALLQAIDRQKLRDRPFTAPEDFPVWLPAGVMSGVIVAVVAQNASASLLAAVVIALLAQMLASPSAPRTQSVNLNVPGLKAVYVRQEIGSSVWVQFEPHLPWGCPFRSQS